MTAPARFLQGDIERVIKAAKNCGFEEIRIRIDLGGEIEAIMGRAANDKQPPVELE